MENSEALVLFSELSRATVESRLKVLVQLLLTKYGPTHGLWKWGRDRRASDGGLSRAGYAVRASEKGALRGQRISGVLGPFSSFEKQ